jgi:DNA repair protein RadC
VVCSFQPTTTEHVMNKNPSEQSSEALLLCGEAAHLSTLDLLTILIGSSAAAVVTSFSTLAVLDDASAQELSDVPGLNTDAVVRLLAVRELGRRRALERALKGVPILSAAAAVDILEPLLRDETREVVMVLALDTKRRLVTAPITIAIGTNDSVPVHPREIFRPLIKAAASSCLIAHLHPSSGEPVPSPDDVMLTARLKEAGDLFGIPLLDHVVIGRGCYLSMADRGLI